MMSIPTSAFLETDASRFRLNTEAAVPAQYSTANLPPCKYRIPRYGSLHMYPGIAVLVAVATELVWTTEFGNPVYCVGPGTT